MQHTDMYTSLRESIAGRRPVDEQTRQSVLLAAERLELLKRQHPMLASIGFSPEMERLAEQSAALLVS